eukprot:TRINITY_DN4917_c0_g4_i1.p1 TRINITY_DN4917_c0_g4~~TRINITY_DN4917_c0_g4_i1.p1  ORF type:complete len:633 (-),score=181.51 TRINITY_DN4917_c0_g4_i1:124-2022(-)
MCIRDSIMAWPHRMFCSFLSHRLTLTIPRSTLPAAAAATCLALQLQTVHTQEPHTRELDGRSLTTADLYALSRGQQRIGLSSDAHERVLQGRGVVDNILSTNEVVYGINTGFGLFSNVVVDNAKLGELQENLIRSHCSGVGPLLSRERTRMLLALRINVLAKGHSGISMESLQRMIAAFNADCLPAVPSKGTVGASGDLAPLSHLALGLMGEGKMWDTDGSLQDAAVVLKRHGVTPVKLGAKEGLAMINGTQLIASLGSEAVERASTVALCADVACALSLEVLCGTVKAFHPLIHQVRPHDGQQLVASRVRQLLCPDSPSELFQHHGYKGKVQDAYSLRCTPQVHGIANDVLGFVRSLLNVELNSATDNPMVFTQEQVDASAPMGFKRQHSPTSATVLKDGEVKDLATAKDQIKQLKDALAEAMKPKLTGFKKESDLSYQSARGLIISGGNFHGEYPAKALDILAIGIHELAAISERRIERMCNPSLSGLPAFLVQDGGFNSGFMIAHCTAAALVSENKVLCHPSSVDSISTSGAKEDHVSMGGFSARKALEVVEHVETVIAIELLAACQGLEFHRPRRTTPALEAVYNLVRSEVKPWDKDRQMSPDIEAVSRMIRDGRLWQAVAPYLNPRP